MLLKMKCQGTILWKENSITAIGSVILQTAVNGLESTAVASMTAGGKFAMFFYCPYDEFGATMATYAGQNVGACRLDRVTKGMLHCSYLAAAYCVLAGVFLIGFGKLAIFAGVAEMVGRSAVGFGFVTVFGFTAACLASPAAWILADLFLIPAYCYCVRELEKIIEK